MSHAATKEQCSPQVASVVLPRYTLRSLTYILYAYLLYLLYLYYDVETKIEERL